MSSSSGTSSKSGGSAAGGGASKTPPWQYFEPAVNPTWKWEESGTQCSDALNTFINNKSTDVWIGSRDTHGDPDIGGQWQYLLVYENSTRIKCQNAYTANITWIVPDKTGNWVHFEANMQQLLDAQDETPTMTPINHGDWKGFVHRRQLEKSGKIYRIRRDRSIGEQRFCRVAGVLLSYDASCALCDISETLKDGVSFREGLNKYHVRDSRVFVNGKHATLIFEDDLTLDSAKYHFANEFVWQVEKSKFTLINEALPKLKGDLNVEIEQANAESAKIDWDNVDISKVQQISDKQQHLHHEFGVLNSLPRIIERFSPMFNNGYGDELVPVGLNDYLSGRMGYSLYLKLMEQAKTKQKWTLLSPETCLRIHHAESGHASLEKYSFGHFFPRGEQLTAWLDPTLGASSDGISSCILPSSVYDHMVGNRDDYYRTLGEFLEGVQVCKLKKVSSNISGISPEYEPLPVKRLGDDILEALSDSKQFDLAMEIVKRTRCFDSDLEFKCFKCSFSTNLETWAKLKKKKCPQCATPIEKLIPNDITSGGSSKKKQKTSANSKSDALIAWETENQRLIQEETKARKNNDKTTQIALMRERMKLGPKPAKYLPLFKQFVINF